MFCAILKMSICFIVSHYYEVQTFDFGFESLKLFHFTIYILTFYSRGVLCTYVCAFLIRNLMLL